MIAVSTLEDDMGDTYRRLIPIVFANTDPSFRSSVKESTLTAAAMSFGGYECHTLVSACWIVLFADSSFLGHNTKNIYAQSSYSKWHA
jgi:hypothetical protein